MSIKREKRLIRLNQARRKLKSQQDVILSSPDKPLIIIIIILIIFGTMAILSAGAPEGIDLYNNPAYYAIKHIAFVIIGLVFMIITANFDYKNWKDLAIPFSLITIALIGATYVPGLGKESYGASRWLVGLPIQPSELAKIASILLISSALVNSKSLINHKMFSHFFLIGLMILLILFQPNLSIAAMITLITAVIMLAGGVSFWLFGGLAASAGLFLYTHILSTSYQLNRITGWLDPWADPQGTGYNLIQSWYAIGSGGIWGVGFGNSKQKLFWLPFRHTDFIFSIIAEELGLIGCLILIGLFVVFIYRGFLIANRCSDSFGRLVAFGITFIISFQAFVNIGVAVGVLPVTGVTLPLISYGGSSVVITMTMLGILLNISRKRIRKIQPQEATNEA
ncbi:MAG: putative lipid II flippase FtsW [bacterium]